MEWLNENRIAVDPPRKPKKITGTRFASILGLNTWNTPFKTWCEITRTYEEPFEDTIYTIAGKVIEPKQAEYMKQAYYMTGITSPTDMYGADYFKRTRGDFFPENPRLGGMWDYLLYEDGMLKPCAVFEMKTTKRAEDWQYDIPEYYALQAALYAYLLGVDTVYMVASFLADADYEHPEKFLPSAENTVVITFNLSERYPDFRQYIERVEQWWVDHVETGISPAYDEKKDADILDALRTNNLAPDTDINALIAEGEEIKAKIDAVSEKVKPLEDRLKKISEIIKKHAVNQFREGDKKVTLAGSRYEWSVSKTESTEVDKEALEKDGLLDLYTKSKVTFRLTTKAVKEG